jgi:hypothetical protein
MKSPFIIIIIISVKPCYVSSESSHFGTFLPNIVGVYNEAEKIKYLTILLVGQMFKATSLVTWRSKCLSEASGDELHCA